MQVLRNGCVVLLAALGLVVPVAARATIWHVTYDPEEPEDRVGSSTVMAASGDTILIEPGTYYEHIPLEGKSLTFIGGAGASATILDGSRPLPGREGSIIYTLTGEPAILNLQGLTLRNGKGGASPEAEGSIAGGAVLWFDNGQAFLGSDLIMSGCIFEGNSTGDPYNPLAQGGGAVYAAALRNVRIEQCAFLGNSTRERGGDLHLWAEEILIAGCSFRVDYVGSSDGVSIYQRHRGVLTIRDCSFESAIGSPSTPDCYGVVAEALKIEIQGNEFVDRGCPTVTRMLFDYRGLSYPWPLQTLRVSGNVFWNAAGSDSGGPFALISEMPNASVTVSENTFARCGMNVVSATGPPHVIEKNIIAGGDVVLHIQSGGSVTCNDFWKATVTDARGNLALSNNLSEPPLFCNETAGDFSIADSSPCSAEHSPSGCGRIGALDPACTGSAIRQVTWGRIKSLFR